MKRAFVRILNLVSIIVAAFFLSACIPSLNPFYSEKDVVFEPGLVGKWGKQEGDEAQTWSFARGDTNAYKLTIEEKSGKKGEFTAYLFKIKKERFLDLAAAECDFATNQIDLVGFTLIPGHLLMRVSQIEPTLKLSFLNFDWLQKHLEKNPKALKHRKEGGGIILTAETPQLQRFVMRHLPAGEIFKESEELIRK